MTPALSFKTFRPLALIATLIAALSLGGCGVNNIPTYEQSAKAAWAEVQNQYKRRTDLIPNLVESVKGFAEQERKVLTDVTEARAKATSVQIPADILTNPEAMKQYQDAQNTLGGALRQLLAVVERYPDIKSGQNFLALQSQIEGTENRINITIRDYNAAVQSYNTTIRTFPDMIGAKIIHGAKPMVPFEAKPGADQAPTVDFSKG